MLAFFDYMGSRFKIALTTVLVLLVPGVAYGLTPTTLNLSQDLVANGIAAQNMVPNSPTLDSRSLFQAGVNYANQHHIPTVTADRGNYYFLTQNSPYQHVFLNAITNVTVDLQYSDLYFAHGNIMGLDLANCVNVTLKNFTADYLQLPFTQVMVTGVNATTRTVNFAQSGAYPLPSFFNSLTVPSGVVNDGYYAFAFRNGVQLRGTGRMAFTGPLNDSSVQITDTSPWSQSAEIADIQPGDTLVIIWRAGVGTIFASGCTGLTVQNVSIYASGFIGILTSFGSAITVDHVQVMPRPGTNRLISTNADGIHLGDAGANNVISNNTVWRGCDDAIAIDGQWYAIVNAPNNGANVQVARHNTAPLAIGVSFDFINITNATVVGTASIIAESPPPNQQAGTDGELITLTLDHAINGLQQNFGVAASDPALRGSGTVISGNLVKQETFARGIYPAGVSNVTITDNLVESTNQSNILVEQDEGLTYNYKTGPSSGITIKNNILDHALGYGMPSNGLLSEGGAINVEAFDQNFAWVSTTPFSNIAITGNFVSNSARSGIRMENVAGGQITGNTLLNNGLQPTDYLWYLPCCESLAQVEAEFAQPVVVLSSSAVNNANNTTTGQYVMHESSADRAVNRLAPGSVAVAIGQNLGATTALASSSNLPTSLGGVTVMVKDSLGVSRLAGLYYSSPTQIFYVVPAGTAAGVATVTVGNIASATLIAPVAPGLFAADGSGQGVAAALAVRTSANSAQVLVPVFECGLSTGCASIPMDLGLSTDVLTVQFFATGIRGFSSLSNVVAEIGGVPAAVASAGPVSGFDGLDQVTLIVPPSLAGMGNVGVVLTVDGITANVTSVNIK